MKRLLVSLLLVGAAALGPAGSVQAVLPGAIDDHRQTGGHVTVDPGPDPAPDPSRTSPPGSSRGEAEPAPASAGEPTPSARFDGAPEGPPPRHRMSVMPRFAYRLGDAGRAVTPAPGFGVGGTVEFSYFRRGQAPGGGSASGGRAGTATWEAALGIDFGHDRFATSEQGSVTDESMVVQTFASTRVVSETSFVLLHTVAARLGRVRPYLSLGAGLGVGYFDSAASELRPGTSRDAHLLGRASLGFDVSLSHSLNVAIRADYTAVRGASPLVTDEGRTLAIFGDLFGLGAGIAYRF